MNSQVDKDLNTGSGGEKAGNDFLVKEMMKGLPPGYVFSQHPYHKPLARRLRFALQKVGVKRSQLAALIGVTPDTVGQWRNGKSRPTNERLQALLNWIAAVEAAGPDDLRAIALEAREARARRLKKSSRAELEKQARDRRMAIRLVSRAVIDAYGKFEALRNCRELAALMEGLWPSEQCHAIEQRLPEPKSRLTVLSTLIKLYQQEGQDIHTITKYWGLYFRVECREVLDALPAELETSPQSQIDEIPF